jgi:uncharacterized protein (DUF2336 family)
VSIAVLGGGIMSVPKSFLHELNEAISRGSAESREKALWYAADVLTVGTYSDEDIWVFGEVVGRLANSIEVAARAKLSQRYAHASTAPANVIKKLAFDDSIEVARPILTHSDLLDSKTLIRNIREKSQSHLLAISKRKSIPSVVTDELVTRGNQEVVGSVAENTGAQISDFGFLHMIKRSNGDSILIEQLGHRKDIPRPIFQQLISKASADVRRKLELERPDLIGEIQTSVVQVAGSLQSRFGPASKGYFETKRAVTVRHQRGLLNERSIVEYALAHKVEETTVGLSLLCTLPIGAVEMALMDREMTLILAKSRGFDWDTAMALLFLGAKDHRIKSQELHELKEEFERLDTRTSQAVLNYYRSRKHPTARDSDLKRLPQLHRV